MNNLPQLVNAEDTELKNFALSIDDSYTYELKHYVGYLNKLNMKFNFESFKTYSKEMKKAGIPAKTINKRILGVKKRIRQIFTINIKGMDIVKKYHLDQCLNEIKLIKLGSRTVSKKKKISIDEYKKLIDSAKLPQDIKLIMEFMFKTGCRISATLNIRLKSIKEYKDGIEIEMLKKGDKSDIVTLADIDTYNRIRDYFKGKQFLFEKDDGTQYTRNQVTMCIKGKGKKILDRNIGSHTMRHSFANIMIEKTGKIKATSKALSHASTATTMDMYYEETFDKEELRIIQSL